MEKDNGEQFRAYEPTDMSMVDSSIEFEKLELANKLEELTVKKVTDDDRIKLINGAIEISTLENGKYADLQQYWIEFKGKYSIIMDNYEILYEKALNNELTYKEEYRIEMINLHEMWKYINRITQYKEKSNAKRIKFEEQIEREIRLVQAEKSEKSAKIRIQSEIIDTKNKNLSKLHEEIAILKQKIQQSPTIDIENCISVIDYRELEERVLRELKILKNCVLKIKN